MKKYFIIIILAFTALQLTNCSSEEKSITGNDGLVNFVTGDVKAISDNVTSTVNTGDKIIGGMTIKTGVKSIVEIQFQGSVIRINEKSSTVMTELTKNLKDNSENTGIYVENGQALFKVTRKLTSNEKFNVNTPTSVAGVRGTEFIVTSDNDKSTISCVEGKVAVRKSSGNDSDFVMVEAGREAVVEKDKEILLKDIQDTSDKSNGKKIEKKITPVAEEPKGPRKIRAQSIKGDIEAGK